MRGSQRVTDQNPEGKYQALERYGRDLTELARKGKLDPVIGRDEEIRRVIQVLSRRTKNNPVLIGEPGVGKTAIVEGLAQRIVRGDVPEGLKDKRIVGAGHGRAGRRREVPRRVRGAAQGGAQGDRRSPRGRSSSSSTSCTRWSAPARPKGPSTPRTCSSRCWRAANCTRSAPPRSTSTASTSRRTRRWSGASSRSWSASRPWRTPSASCAACASATRSTTACGSRTPRWSRRRCSRTATSPTASCRTRRSTWWTRPRRSCGWRSTRCRPSSTRWSGASCSSRSSARRCARRPTRPRTSGWPGSRRSWPTSRRSARRLASHWEQEKRGHPGRTRSVKEEIEQVRLDVERAQRTGDYAKASELQYGRRPRARAQARRGRDGRLADLQADGRMLKEEVDEEDIAEVVCKWTRIPVSRLMEGEIQKLAAHGGAPAPARGGPGRGDRRRGQRHPARARRPAGPEPAARQLHVPRARPASARPSWRGRSPSSCSTTSRRMVRIDMSEYQEKHTVSRHDRRAAGLRRATRRRASSPRPCGGGPTRSCSSTRSRRRTPRCSTSCSSCSTTGG